MAEQTPSPQPSSPLSGKRVVITRAESQSAALAAALESRGAHVYSLPLIQILPPLDFAPLDFALHDLANFDWLIFTSQNAVTAVADRLAAFAAPNSVIPSEARNLSSANIFSAPSVRIAAVGKATAEAAQQAGFSVAHVGQGGTAATLVLELISELHEKRVLLPRSDRAASELVPRLQRFGAEVIEVIAYRTADTTSVDSASREAVAASDAILFFSPSAVHSFAALQKSTALNQLADTVVVGAIGPVTSVALRNAGLRCDFQASEPSVEEIVATLTVHFEKISIQSQSASGANS